MSERTELDVAYEELCAAYRKQSRGLILLISFGVGVTILAFFCGVNDALGNHPILAFLMFCLTGFDAWTVSLNIKRFVLLRTKQRAAALSYKLVGIIRMFHTDSSDETTISSD